MLNVKQTSKMNTFIWIKLYWFEKQSAKVNKRGLVEGNIVFHLTNVAFPIFVASTFKMPDGHK